MSTRLYPNKSTAAAVSPAYDASWEGTGSAVRRLLGAVPDGSSFAVGLLTSTANGTNPNDQLWRQFVSAPLAAQTITGTIKGQFLVEEAQATLDADAQLVVRVVSNDGSTVRGTLLASDTSALSSEFVATTYTNRKFPKAAGSPATLSSVAVLDGDRIVAEVGMRVHSTIGNVSGFTLGGTGASDLPEDETTTANGYAWIEFSADIPFLITASDSGSGADASSETATHAVTDTGAGADASSLASAITATGETGTGTSASSLAVAHARAESGTAVESATVRLASVVPDLDAGWIECWVTDPAGTYLAHLDRSAASPFRAFSFQIEVNGVGSGYLEAGTPNALLAAVPTLLDADNLVWMRYRGRLVTWIIEQVVQQLAGEETDWRAVSGRGALQLLGDRLILPDGFSEDDLDPSVWSGPGVLTATTTRAADAGDRVLVVDPLCTDGRSVDRLREGQRVTITTGADTDTSHIRRMRLRDDGDWALTIKDALAHDHAAGSAVTRHGPAFVATTLVASVMAGKRRLHVESAKRLHPGAKILITSGITGEYAIVREVEHVKAKPADSASVAVAASSGAHAVTISGKHFHVGEDVTITGGGNHETHTVTDHVLVSSSPLRYRLHLDGDLAHAYGTSADVSRDAVAESWIVTLRRELENGYPIGADVSRPSDQWHTVVGMAAGEMLWELIADSNPRVAAQILPGTIEADPDDADQWVQRFRNDNLLDVTTSVTDAYGDVSMDGLTWNYLLSLGTDRSATVLLEEGMDILRVERDVDHRDAVTWVLAEGVGEGSRARLAVASDDTAGRRREAYLDAHDATNLPMLEAAADAALAQNGPTDAIGLELAETRWLAFTDYDLGDWVRAIAPSRGIDDTVRIVAMTVAETDERVRVSIDVNSRRTEALLELEKGAQASRRTLGIHGRQPQGTLGIISVVGSGVLDDTTDGDMEVMFAIPERAFLVHEATINVQLRRFWATATSAVAASSTTVGSTTPSGGSTTTQTDGASAPTSEATLESTDHSHGVFGHIGAADGTFTNKEYFDALGTHVNLETPSGSTSAIETDTQAVPHTHVVHVPNHQHDTKAHVHDIPALTVNAPSVSLVYGIFREPMPDEWAVKVFVDRKDGTTWTNVWTSGVIADPTKFADYDLSAIVTEPGSWRIRVKSNAAPDDATWHNGRLAADVWGVIVVGLEGT